MVSRLAGLDGIRGVAALFVVLHHCWLLSFPGFPTNNGPLWTGWLVYGHLAVAVFIVLSGFSLAVAPARSGWRLRGLRQFAHRRAWRILPPYWPALLFSLVIGWTLAAQPGEGPPTVKSVVVYGLLLQDVLGAPSPNGAFWSIAIEAQLYLALPLLLLLVRRVHPLAMLGGVTALVALIGVLAPGVPAVALFMRFTPQFAALFALGVVAAWVLTDPARWRRVPLPWLALGAAVPPITLIAIMGPEWTVAHYFWVDLACGPAIALLLASFATGRPARLASALDTRPLRGLGSFSYSLYLTHAPIVVAIHQWVVAPRFAGVAGFVVMLALAAPISVVFARLFAAAFELPFQRHRNWLALRTAVLPRRWYPRASAVSPAVDAATSTATPGPPR